VLATQLIAGARLGPYKILAPIGAGGMGEVYRANDTRLDRLVALKILPSHVSADPMRRERFEREARAVAALNHPNICTLYDVGSETRGAAGPPGEEVRFLVMELVEGESLADRLAKGPLPLEQAISTGAQIADALACAHRRGIAHRDLKPGNVMLARTGAKVLDFGLAKLLPSSATGAGADAQTQAVTEAGMILGTPQYMAPEQLEGRDADERSDIFAFGALLYEMVSGRKAFEATSRASLIATIFEKQPPSLQMPLAPSTTLAALDRIVRTSLAKDPALRWQNASDIAIQLRWLEAPGAPDDAAAAARSQGSTSRTRERLAWVSATVSTVGLAAAVLWFLARPAVPAPGLRRFALQPPSGAVFGPSSAGTAPFPSISPDGASLVFVAQREDEPPSLWVRSLDALDARPLPGTLLGTTAGNVGLPFWSPDGRAIGFFGEGKLKRAELDGGTAKVLADAPQPNGGAWAPDGTIIFHGTNPAGLHSLSPKGGAPTVLTTLGEGESSHAHPAFLPDGRHFLFWVRSATPGLWIGSLDSSERTRLLDSDSRGVYAAPGYVLFAREATLFAQRFDAARLALDGDPFPVAEGVRVNVMNGRAAFTVSSTGVLAYRTGDVVPGTPLSWYDRTGRWLGAVRNSEASYQSFRLALDDRQAIGHVVDGGGGGDVWTIDLDRGMRTRITFAPSRESWPVLSPDAAWVAFQSNRVGRGDIYRRRVSGAGDDELLVQSGAPKIPTDWSARSIVFTAGHPQHRNDIWTVPSDKSSAPRLYLRTDFNESQGRLSPDERWMAYASDETGESQVYVRTFPDANAGKWRVSDAGGRLPVWRADGKELFYLTATDDIVAVPIASGSTSPGAGVPRALFQLQRAVGISSYGVSRDGTRFLASTRLAEAPAQQSSPLTIVLNWTSLAENK
jgi:serine/threonine protein kinase/Tol biopolymer transport system component